MQDGSGTNGTLIVTGSRAKDISIARRFVRTTLRGVVSPTVATDMELIASELVTNAVRHGSREPLVVTVHADRRTTSVTIEHDHDHLDDIPKIAQWEMPAPSRPSGRGLGLVRALSDEVTVGVHGDTLSITASVATTPIDDGVTPLAGARRARRSATVQPVAREARVGVDRVDVLKDGYQWTAVKDGQTVVRATTKREVLRSTVALTRQGGPAVLIRIHTASGTLQKQYVITPDGARRPA
jgi:anti-sigma regulatory factor (Ser/Thr protein kinase)